LTGADTIKWSNFVDFHLGSRNFNLTLKVELSFIRLGSAVNLQTLSSIPLPWFQITLFLLYKQE